MSSAVATQGSGVSNANRTQQSSGPDLRALQEMLRQVTEQQKQDLERYHELQRRQAEKGKMQTETVSLSERLPLTELTVAAFPRDKESGAITPREYVRASESPRVTLAESVLIPSSCTPCGWTIPTPSPSAQRDNYPGTTSSHGMTTPTLANHPTAKPPLPTVNYTAPPRGIPSNVPVHTLSGGRQSRDLTVKSTSSHGGYRSLSASASDRYTIASSGYSPCSVPTSTIRDLPPTVPGRAHSVGRTPVCESGASPPSSPHTHFHTLHNPPSTPLLHRDTFSSQKKTNSPSVSYRRTPQQYTEYPASGAADSRRPSTLLSSSNRMRLRLEQERALLAAQVLRKERPPQRATSLGQEWTIREGYHISRPQSASSVTSSGLGCTPTVLTYTPIGRNPAGEPSNSQEETLRTTLDLSDRKSVV